jgi:hypothetical protein
LFLTQNICPSFIKLDVKNISQLEQVQQENLNNTIKEINLVYHNFLENESIRLSSKLLTILPSTWSLPDTCEIGLKKLSQEQYYLNDLHKGKNQLASSYYQQKHPIISLHGNPEFHNQNLMKDVKRIIQSFDPLHRPVTPCFSNSQQAHNKYILRQLHKGIYSIDSNKEPTIFNKDILEALSLGLKFVPNNSKAYPIKTLAKSFADFNHKLSWKIFWSQKKTTLATNTPLDLPPLKLRQKLARTKAPSYPTLSAFVKSSYNKLINDLTSSKDRLVKPSLRDIQIKRMLNFFKKHKDNFVIKPADKGGAIVIIHADFYRDSIEKMLQKSKTFFVPILGDPTTTLCLEVTQIINNLLKHSLIDHRTKEMIAPDEKSRCPSLYGLPKIHNQSIPFRPILSGNGHPTENSSILIDYLLQPISTSHPYYLKDTTDLLNLLSRRSIPIGSMLFTLDVVGMYTNIPIPEAINAVENAITTNISMLTRNKITYKKGAIMTLVSMILNKNFFKFNNTYYYQRHGIAMGTPCACTVADIFICDFITKAFTTCKFLPHIYKQYRDDGIGVWCHGLNELNEFVSHLNSLHDTIKFTMTTGESIDYLDVTLKINSDRKIQSQTYYKKTATFDYLHPDSNHPRHCKENITISQNIRHIRNCTQYSTYNYHIQLLKLKLSQKGYSPKLLQKKLIKHSYQNRRKLLEYKQKTNTNRVPLVITYDIKLPNIPNILKTELRSHDPEGTLLKQIGETPITGYQIQDSLGKKLVRAEFKSKHII